MTLAATVETLQKRPLSSKENTSLANFQRKYSVGDDDPLIVVLEMMAQNQSIVDKLPDLLQQKVGETIELHRNTLREQSTLIAKELIVELTKMIHTAARAKDKSFKEVAGSIAAVFLFGVIVGGTVTPVVAQRWRAPIAEASTTTTDAAVGGASINHQTKKVQK